MKNVKVKGTVKEKWKAVYDVPVSRNEYEYEKLCQIYTKIHIYAILYKGCRFKQIIFSKYETNIKKNYIQQKPANLRFAPIPPFNFLSSGPLKGQATNFQKNLYLKSYGLDSQLSYLDPCLIIDINKKKNRWILPI